MGRKMWMGALVLAALLAVTACGGREAQPPSGPDEAGPQPGVSVTDPAVLAWLWEDYLYGSIFTLGNGQDFDAAAGELPYRHSALEYAVWYLVMNDPEGMFDPATAEPFVALPDETVAEWALRLTGVELGSIDYARDYEYSSVFASGENRIDWSQARQSWGTTPYTENTPWGIRLDGVTHDAQAGTYTARLANYVRSGGDARANRIFEYTLRETKDVLQFVARRTIIPDISDLVSIEYFGQELDAGAVGAALKGELERFSYTIRVGDVMFVRHWPVRNESDTGYDYVLAGYDMAADAPIGRIELEEQNLYGVRAAEDGGWLLLLPERVMQVDAAMKPVREIELPAPVAASRDNYDCMADGSGFVYMRGGDLMLLRDGEEKLLCSSPPVSRYGYELFIRYPELVRDDTAVVASLVGYESLNGYVYVDLATGEADFYEGYGWEGSRRVGAQVYSLDKPLAESESGMTQLPLELRTLELVSGKARQGELITTGPEQQLFENAPDKNWTVDNGYICYVTHDYASQDDRIDDHYYLVRVDVAMMEAKTLAVFKGWSPQPLYIDADGTVLFKYDFEFGHGVGRVR